MQSFVGLAFGRGLINSRLGRALHLLVQRSRLFPSGLHPALVRCSVPRGVERPLLRVPAVSLQRVQLRMRGGELALEAPLCRHGPGRRRQTGGQRRGWTPATSVIEPWLVGMAALSPPPPGRGCLLQPVALCGPRVQCGLQPDTLLPGVVALRLQCAAGLVPHRLLGSRQRRWTEGGVGLPKPLTAFLSDGIGDLVQPKCRFLKIPSGAAKLGLNKKKGDPSPKQTSTSEIEPAQKSIRNEAESSKVAPLPLQRFPPVPYSHQRFICHDLLINFAEW